MPDYDGQPLLEDLLEHLRGFGYRLFNLYGDAEAPTGQLLWANAVLLSEPFRAELTDHLGQAAPASTAGSPGSTIQTSSPTSFSRAFTCLARRLSWPSHTTTAASAARVSQASR